jgi:hypothetical protein
MVAAGTLPTVKFGGRSLRVPRGVLARLAGEELVSVPAEPAPDQRVPVGGGIEGPAARQV